MGLFRTFSLCFLLMRPTSFFSRTFHVSFFSLSLLFLFQFPWVRVRKLYHCCCCISLSFDCIIYYHFVLYIFIVLYHSLTYLLLLLYSFISGNSYYHIFSLINISLYYYIIIAISVCLITLYFPFLPQQRHPFRFPLTQQHFSFPPP